MKDNEESTRVSLLGWVFLIAIGIWGYHHWFGPDKWQIVYTSDKGFSALTDSYKSKETCVEALHSRHYPEGKCGSNCRPREMMGVYVCEETVD